jgi:hypothetical protein
MPTNQANPYVFDEYLFANQAHLDFDNSTYGLIHKIVDILAPAIGIFTSSLVAYLSLFQTPSYIRAFSRMLFLCSVADILYAVGNFACMAVSFWIVVHVLSLWEILTVKVVIRV